MPCRHRLMRGRSARTPGSSSGCDAHRLGPAPSKDEQPRGHLVSGPSVLREAGNLPISVVCGVLTYAALVLASLSAELLARRAAARQNASSPAVTSSMMGTMSG
jgi:hypothetical protein